MTNVKKPTTEKKAEKDGKSPPPPQVKIVTIEPEELVWKLTNRRQTTKIKVKNISSKPIAIKMKTTSSDVFFNLVKSFIPARKALAITCAIVLKKIPVDPERNDHITCYVSFVESAGQRPVNIRSFWDANPNVADRRMVPIRFLSDTNKKEEADITNLASDDYDHAKTGDDKQDAKRQQETAKKKDTSDEKKKAEAEQTAAANAKREGEVEKPVTELKMEGNTKKTDGAQTSGDSKRSGDGNTDGGPRQPPVISMYITLPAHHE